MSGFGSLGSSANARSSSRTASGRRVGSFDERCMRLAPRPLWAAASSGERRIAASKAWAEAA